tara:strand:+ start:834 stop:1343 length:510 start_codon:yes stop_codon:yes gene_type:complete
MLLNLLIGPITTLIERLIPDKEKSDEAKAEMMNIMVQAQAREIDAKSRVVVAEATGESYIQRTWRPILALTFGLIAAAVIAFNHLVFPILQALGFDVTILPLDVAVWGFLTLCIGGYIDSRGKEKIAKIKASALDMEKYFAVFRNHYGPLSKEFVDIQSKAIKESQNGK